jgi:hypothetical protein
VTRCSLIYADAMIKEISEEEIRILGEKLHSADKHWHLHVLTPECTLNTKTAHAIIVEDSDTGENYVTYSSNPMPETALALATLVHGAAATVPLPDAEPEPDHPIVGRMIMRAKALMAEGRYWHHHIFFPTCTFNSHPGKWTMIFEDPDTKEVLTSVSTERPDKDIGITERLFYTQKH